MSYTIEPRSVGPFNRYAVMRDGEQIAEFLHESQARAFADASEAAGDAGDDFFRGYVECVYFTDTGEEEQPASDTPLADETRAAIMADCHEFQQQNAALLKLAYARGYDAAQAGRDYHFTRNGHGVGYWDRSELKARGLGDALTKAAASRGSTFVFEDDGFLYLE
jgi:hypothetical protein